MARGKVARNLAFAEPLQGQVCDTIPLAEAKVVGQILLYCDDIPATRAAPTPRELDKFWAACAGADSRVVVDAICDQLTEAIAAERWQPQLRLLRALGSFYGRGEAGRRLANSVMAASSKLVEHVAAEVPEAEDEAARLLTIWRLAGALPPGEDIRMADEGGLSCFTDGAHARSSQSSPAAPDAACEEQTSDAKRASTVDLLESTTAADAACEGQTSDAKKASSNDLLEFEESPSSVDLLTLDTSCQSANASPVLVHRWSLRDHGPPDTESAPANARGLHGPSFPAVPSPRLISASSLCNRGLSKTKSMSTTAHELDSLSFPIGSSPRHFYIADAGSGNENRELDSMFDFGQLQDNPCRRQLRFAPLAADSIMNRQLPRRKDPFDALSGHFDLLRT